MTTVTSHFSCSSVAASDLLLVYDGNQCKMFYLHPPHHRDDGENTKTDSLSMSQYALRLYILDTWKDLGFPHT